MREPALSVVVMGYRNESTIIDAVASVVDQAACDGSEVVVVTSGGDGSRAKVAASFPGVRVVESERRLLPGAARNAGVRATRGEHVAFLAADCVAEPGWVGARLSSHRAGHRAVAGAMTTRAGAGRAARASHYLLFGARLSGRPAGIVRFPDPAAHGISYARSLLAELGPFDETCLIGEDTDMARRCAGEEIWFDPDVRTAHRGPASARALVRDEYRRAAHYARRERGANGSRVHRAAAATEGQQLVRQLRATAHWARRHGGEGWLSLTGIAPWLIAGALARRFARFRTLTETSPA